MGYGDWTASAQHASNDARGRQIGREIDLERMKEGPFYEDRTHTLRIPSYVFYPVSTPIANAEWKRRGLRWDRVRYQWYCKIEPEHAVDQVEKARKVFYEIWHFKH